MENDTKKIASDMLSGFTNVLVSYRKIISEKEFQTISQARTFVKDVVILSGTFCGLVIPLLFNLDINFNGTLLRWSFLVFTVVVLYGVSLLFWAFNFELSGLRKALKILENEYHDLKSLAEPLYANPTPEETTAILKKIENRLSKTIAKNSNWLINAIETIFFLLFILAIILLFVAVFPNQYLEFFNYYCVKIN